ncbi:MAG: hypothetical protein CL843_11145 [Crocinitomicaceae bacterium]|nr:hypothetical protein [Crocinitomicaceae bacterium]
MKSRILALAILVLSGLSVMGQNYGTGEDSLKCLENLSLFNEFYKQQNYTNAYTAWTKTLGLCPASSKNLYIKGAGMVNALIKAEKDPAKKQGLIDTLLWSYDLRIENYGEEGYVLGRKSAELLKYKSNEPQLAFDAASKSLELRGNQTEAGVLQTYYFALNLLVKAGEKEPSMMLQEFPRVMEIIKVNKQGKYAQYYEMVEKPIQDLFAPYATCEALVELYQGKFEATPNDTNLQKEIMKFFEMRDCTGEALFMNVAKAYDKVNPSAKSKFNIGVGLYKESKYGEAINYLEESVSLSNVQEDKAITYKYLCYAALQAKRYSSVKSYALKWLAIEPNTGEAYKLIGDAYFYGSRSCGENSCEQAYGYIAAISKYYKAKSLDADLTSACDKMIGQAQANYPKKEECFFLGLTDGQEVKVGCWINETVQLKTRP